MVYKLLLMLLLVYSRRSWCISDSGGSCVHLLWGLLSAPVSGVASFRRPLILLHLFYEEHTASLCWYWYFNKIQYLNLKTHLNLFMLNHHFLFQSNTSVFIFSFLIFHIFKLFFKYSCLHSPPTPAILTSLPWSCSPLALSMCPLYMFLTTLPPFPSLSSPTSPLVTVSLFLISMSLAIFCLLIYFVD